MVHLYVSNLDRVIEPASWHMSIISLLCLLIAITVKFILPAVKLHEQANIFI